MTPPGLARVWRGRPAFLQVAASNTVKGSAPLPRFDGERCGSLYIQRNQDGGIPPLRRGSRRASAEGSQFSSWNRTWLASWPNPTSWLARSTTRCRWLRSGLHQRRHRPPETRMVGPQIWLSVCVRWACACVSRLSRSHRSTGTKTTTETPATSRSLGHCAWGDEAGAPARHPRGGKHAMIFLHPDGHPGASADELVWFRHCHFHPERKRQL